MADQQMQELKRQAGKDGRSRSRRVPRRRRKAAPAAAGDPGVVAGDSAAAAASVKESFSRDAEAERMESDPLRASRLNNRIVRVVY